MSTGAGRTRRSATSPSTAPDAATLLRWVVESLPPRRPVTAASTAPMPTRRAPTQRAERRSVWFPAKSTAQTSAADGEAVELSYDAVDWKPAEGGAERGALRGLRSSVDPY